MHFLLSVLIIIAASVFFHVATTAIEGRRDTRKGLAQLKERETQIRKSLDYNRYKIYGGLKTEVDPEQKTFTIIGDRLSHKFDIDQVNDSWWIYVYNQRGERQQMSPESFEMYLLEVRDKEKDVRTHVGFNERGDIRPVESTARQADQT